MAIQVLGGGPTKPRNPTFAQKLAGGVERGLNAAEEMRREYEKEQYQKKERESIAKFLEDEYGVKNASNLPQDFQKEILKGETANKGRKLSSDNKAPLGGLTGQPVPKEISEAMGHIVSLNPNANSDELKMHMDEIGIPPAY